MGIKRLDDGITNGEIVATVAPLLDRQPDQIEHVVILYVTAIDEEGQYQIGVRTTECDEHTVDLCEYVAQMLKGKGTIEMDEEGNIL